MEDTSQDKKKTTYDTGFWPVYKTVCLYSTFISLGSTALLFGPSLLDLVYILQIDIKTFGLVFTVGAFGYLTGALLCGLLYDYLNPELLFLSCASLMGVTTICLPWITVFPLFAALMFLLNTAAGFMDAGGQAYIVAIWSGTKFLEPTMQGMHMVFCIGATISPLIVQQFMMPQTSMANDKDTCINNFTGTSTMYPTILSEKHEMGDLDGNGTNLATGSSVLLVNITKELDGNTTDGAVFEQYIGIHYAFLIVGCYCLFTALLFVIAFLHAPKFICRKKLMNTADVPTKDLKREIDYSRKFRYGLLLILYFFYVTYAWSERVLGAFLATFVVKSLKWEKYKGSIITSVFLGSAGAGRVAGILISAFCTPRQMVYANTIMTILAGGVMFVSTYTTDVLMWIGIVMFGLAIATTFASVILWARAYITIDGQAGGVFLMGASTGGMTGPALVGFLFETFSHMWMLYFTLGASVLNLLIFLSADIFASSYKKRVEKQTANQELGTEIKLL